MSKKPGQKKTSHLTAAVHRRAKLDYEILKSLEAGLVLQGSEVKSLRQGRCQIKDSYVIVQNGEVYLHHLHISPYPPAGKRNHPPERKRKLLLNSYEIQKLIGEINQKGMSCIPLKIYFKNNKAKAELALVRGRKKWDKRQYLKKKEMEKTARRASLRDKA